MLAKRTARMAWPVPDRGSRLLSGADTRALLALFDYGLAAYVIFISTSSFTFLGIHGPLWLLAYAAVAMRIALSYRAFLAFCRQNLLLLSYAALCAVSVLWSDIPTSTLHFSVILLVTTVISLFIAMRLTLREYFLIFSSVNLLLMLVSLANINGSIAPAYNEMGRFTGIFRSKSAIGHAAIDFSLAATFVVCFVPGVGVAVRAVFLVSLLATVFMSTIMGSATAILLMITFPVLAIWLAFVIYVRWGAFVTVIPACLGLTLLMIIVFVGGVDPVTPILDMLGKDATLTGRTVLWQLGSEAYLSRPVLGLGADGFWENPDYRYHIQVVQRLYGENVVGFHNLVVELLVALGPLGLAVHLGIGGVALYRGVRRLRVDGDPVVLWALLMVASLYVQAMVAPGLYAPHTSSYMSLIILAASLGKAQPPAVPRPGRATIRSTG